MKAFVTEAYVTEGLLYEVPGEDGPEFYFNYYVEAVTDRGTYCHVHTFLGHEYGSKEQAEKLVKKVLARRHIDTKNWDYVVPVSPSYSLGQVDEASLMDDEERAHRGM